MCKKEENITYVREDWDLYICQFLIQVREYKESIDMERKLIEKSHHIESVLFQEKSPERALDWSLEFMSNHSDSDHDGKYDLRELECVGIYNLDSTQSSVAKISNEVTSDIGFSVDCINIENIDIAEIVGTPSKERLSLFNGARLNT